jgi:hypothetical protein
MAFVTGNANSLADLLTAINNACTANGYTLNGNILSKGTLHVSMEIASSQLRITGGTGRSGTTLLGPGPQYAKIGPTTQVNMVFPVTYHIHILTAPDEVYVMINYNAVYWNFIAFGQSDHPGIAAAGGTGNWYGATHPQPGVMSGEVVVAANGGGGGFGLAGGAGVRTGAGLFNGTSGWTTSNYATNCLIHSGLNPGNGGWNDPAVSPSSGLYGVNAIQYQEPMLAYLPNAWNAQTVLVPICVTSLAASSKSQVVAELRHARYLRNDNYNDIDIITIGSDQWRVYPYYRKDASARNGGSLILHSGTFAHAIRYDGP